MKGCNSKVLIDKKTHHPCKMFCDSPCFLFILLFEALMLSDGTEIRIATTSDMNLLFANEHIFMQIIDPVEISYLYKLRPAKNFGGDFTKVHSQIELVIASPYHGCGHFINRNQLSGRIVLLQRGECSFVTKTYNAQQAGAVAAIITDSNTENFENQIDMIEDGTERKVTIPSLFLLGKHGHMIKKALEAHDINAVVNIPINITAIPMSTSMQPPWTFW